MIAFHPDQIRPWMKSHPACVFSRGGICCISVYVRRGWPQCYLAEWGTLKDDKLPTYPVKMCKKGRSLNGHNGHVT